MQDNLTFIGLDTHGSSVDRFGIVAAEHGFTVPLVSGPTLRKRAAILENLAGGLQRRRSESNAGPFPTERN